MPPLGLRTLSQFWRPLLLEGVKQRRCSPASAALKVKRPEALPRWETTRWSLSKSSYYFVTPPKINRCSLVISQDKQATKSANQPASQPVSQSVLQRRTSTDI